MKFKVSDLLKEMTRCAEVNDQFLKMLVLSDLDAQEFLGEQIRCSDLLTVKMFYFVICRH